MVKKLKQLADKKAQPAAGLLDGALTGSVKESAQQIWLAGMGAFSKAQEEGGKVFEALVKEGLALQRKTQTVAEEKLNEVTSRMTGMATEVQSKAGQHWDKLESIFEERTAKALKKLGVPTAGELASLAERLDAIEAKLGGKPAPRKAAAKKAAAPVKAARKRSAPRRAAAA